MREMPAYTLSRPPSQLSLVLPHGVTNLPLTLKNTLKLPQTSARDIKQKSVNRTPHGEKNNGLAMLMLVVSILFVYFNQPPPKKSYMNSIHSIC